MLNGFRSFLGVGNFSQQGIHYYLITDTRTVDYYTLPSPFDLDNKVFRFNLNTELYMSRTDNVSISDDGKYFYAIGSATNALRFILSKPFDLSTASLDFTIANFDSQEATCFHLENNGTVFYKNNNAGSILQFSLSTPYDIRTRVQTGSLGGFPSNGPGDPAFSPDGTSVVIGRRGGNTIIGGTCSTAFDISTFSQTNTFTTADADPSCCKWNEDGTRLFVRHSSPDMVNEFFTTNPYSLSGMSFVRQVLNNPSYAAGGHDFNYF